MIFGRACGDMWNKPDAGGPSGPELPDLHRFAALGRGLEHILLRQAQIPGGIDGPVDGVDANALAARAETEFDSFFLGHSQERHSGQSDTGVDLDRGVRTVSYTHLRAHETRHDLVCRLLLEKKK